MTLPFYVVDAFTTRLFHGNPAAVCPLEAWLPDALMQQIAAENNLSETAFLVSQANGWRLRWFTPTVEIELCGHATLASAFVLAQLEPARTQFSFYTLSGELTVTRNGELFTLDFPARVLTPLPREQELAKILGTEVLAVTDAANTWITELRDADTVRQLKPDFRSILTLDCRALVITARGDDCDFVSRFFGPKVGVDEDPVTGSAHCGLVPYWSAKLGKHTLQARQLSARGGELLCELRGDRVLMSGHAVQYSAGRIRLPSP
jgi:PhzF family phenazine biosynthesis protein